ncbi:MAG: peptide chain release factor N(5)-glutamine methyltransferase [archaeon]|jgi:release factor glutamine methyltransferase
MANINKEINWLLKEKYHNQPTKQFTKDIQRLKEGEPLAYVIGFVDFLGCKIDLSKKPLIPRTETEFWVQEALKDIMTSKNFLLSHSLGQNFQILDIFSGSGCIGLAILKNVKNANVIFVDKEKYCLEQIKINCKLNTSLIRANKGCSKGKRFFVVKADVFSAIKGKYDFIFANPPYVPIKNKNKVQKSVLKYEPKKALFGGKDGLFYVKKFLKQAKNYLNSNGKIFMEFDPPQKKEIENLIKKYKYRTYKFNKDQYKKWRWVIID